MPLHKLARVATIVGAIGAVALTLYAGRGTPQRGVMILMAGWVFAPFFGYAVVNRSSARWSNSTRAALDVVLLLIAAAALVTYARDALQPAPRRAAPYVLVPILSWLVLLPVVVAGWLSGRRAPAP
jgi:hypothetical protein